MKLTKRLIAVLLAALLVMTCMPAAVLGAENTEDTVFVYAEPFEGAKTNGTPDTLTVAGAKTRVLEADASNKVFQVMPGAKTTVTAPYSTQSKKYMISMDLSGDSRISADLLLSTGSSNSTLLSIRDNVILTKEGKEVAGVNSNSFTRLAVAVNLKSGTFDLYINNKMALADWKMPATANFNGFSIVRVAEMTESLYLDNLYVYEGEEPVNKLPGAAFNPDGTEFLDYTDDLGDFSFFKSDYITHRYIAYPNTTITPKTNEIICEKFDYKNPNKGDRIIFNKVTNEDLFIDITSKIFTTYRSSNDYKHFKIAGEFMCNFEGDSSLYLYQMRDTSSSGTQVNLYPMTINSDGSMKLINGQTISGAAEKGKWFRVTMYLNLVDHTITMFLDGDKVLDNVGFSNTLNTLNLLRIQCRSGQYTGTMETRHLEFTGLAQPYAGQPEGEETRTSMFGSDQPIVDYLADKTTFHYYGKNIYSNGVKSDMTADPVYQDGEMYVSLEDFNRAYGSAVTLSGDNVSVDGKTVTLTKKPAEQNGVRLIPVMETASALLGYNVFDDTNGFVITSLNKIYFNAEDEVPYHKRKVDTGYIDRFSPLQYIYDYVLFDRPSKEFLLEEFNKSTGNGAKHPRIMAGADDFARIKEQAKTDEYMQKVVNDIIGKADSDCNGEPISFVYQDALRTTTVGDRLRDRMMRCGFAYQMTGEQKYVDCAWANLSALDNFPDINPGHPIDTGSYGMGIAIGYDWFYDAFTEEQRQNIRENAMRLHITVISEGFYGRSPVRGGPDGNINVIGYYNKWISNYNAWVNGGSVAMALAFMEDYPEVCSDMLWHSIRSWEYTFKNLYPDGSWVESTNYWMIVARSIAYAFSTLQEVYGTDFNLSCFPGTKETGPANLALRDMIASYNYHDCGSESSYANFPMAFLGQYFDQPELLAARKATLTKGYDSRMSNQSADVFDALFYEPDVTLDQIKVMPRMYTTRGLELFSVHEDYTKYDGLFLATHGGPVTFYHSHNDNGDFVFDLNGVRWATALPAEDYNSALSASAKYRVRPEGHNTITINNGSTLNQLSNTYAPLIRSEQGEGGALGVYDLSESYADADQFLRGFYVGDNYRSVTIRDEIELNKDNSEIYWFMHTQAAAEVIDDHTVILSNNGQSLTLNFETDAAAAEVSIMDAKPLPSSPQGEQNPNNGFRKVAIRLVGSDKVSLTVRLGEFAGVVDQTPIAEWKVPEYAEVAAGGEDYGYILRMNGIEYDGLSSVPVLDPENLPAFEIIPKTPGMTAEITPSDSLTSPSTVRIYNADKTRYKVFILPYSTMQGIKDIVYDEIPIVDWSVSAEPEPENKGPNMFDNDFGTRWTTLSKGENAVFDLGSVQPIDGLAAGFWQSGAREYYFDLYVSNDGINWNMIDTFTSELGAEDYQVFKFKDVTGRYLKLVGQGNSANVNTNVLELRIVRLKEAYRVD